MKRRRSERHPFEVVIVLILFMLLAIGNAASSKEVKDNVKQEIEVARAERTLALSDIQRILASGFIRDFGNE